MKLKKILAVIAASAIAAAALPSAAITASSYNDGLVVYYDFENDAEFPASITDKSGKGNAATVVNNSTKLTVKNGAAVFPAHSAGTAASTLRLPNGINSGITDFTYAAWVKSEGSDDYVRLFDFGNMANNDTYNSIFLRYSCTTGELFFQDRKIASAMYDSGKYLRVTLSGDNDIYGKWHHVAVTYKKSGSCYIPIIYIDGKAVSPSSPNTQFTRSLGDLGSLTTASNAMFIGRTVWGAADFAYMGSNPDFTGSMDEIRLYNRALSASEIYSLYSDTIHSNPVPGDIVLHYMLGGDEICESKSLSFDIGEVFTPTKKYTDIGALYTLVSVTDGEMNSIGSVTVGTEEQDIYLRYAENTECSGEISAYIGAADGRVHISADIFNGSHEEKTVTLISAEYDGGGSLSSVTVKRADVSPRTESASVSLDVDYSANGKIMLWDSAQPLCAATLLSDLNNHSGEISALIPNREDVMEDIYLANNYYQSIVSSSSENSYWDSAAYHTGNIEAYRLLGQKRWLNYSLEWAQNNNWSGYNTYNSYDADNQTCFQTYIDLYNISPSSEKISEIKRIIDAQAATSSDSYWTWADALYMSMPVFSKMYVLTGDKKYLDAMYKYFRYSMELMYDGEDGIPTSAAGYTTSASLYSGASYSDPDDYRNLFYRDAYRVYPLSSINGTKTFWSRGDGWVFAALAKVLADVPDDWEHYGELLRVYREMAAAIVGCQKTDDDGNGFWTESMLANYPLSPSYNPQGYETSGTAFFTYGLLWGINNGLLDENECIEAALRGWKYLSDVALQPNGLVGYVQEIGAAPQSYAPYNTDMKNYGVGAFLLAGCEMTRYCAKRE